MKEFFKYVGATIVGIVVLCIVSIVLSTLSLIGMASMQGNTSVPDKAVLVIKLDGTISERAKNNPIASVLGKTALEQQGLDEILCAIKNAKANDKVKAIYIQAGAFGGSTPATLQEIRQALVDFKQTTKKPIIAYGEQYTQGAYYLCSVADSVVINPKGMLDWKGLAMQSIYFKDLLDKLGVGMQVFKVGTYKSAVEPYIMNEMSDANKEQVTTFSNEIWAQMLKEVAKSRHLSTAQLNELADSSMVFQETPYYKKAKLVDKFAYTDEVGQIIANAIGVDEKYDYNPISVQDLASVTENEPKGTSGNILAVYYATGEIVDEAASGYTDDYQIVGKKVVDDLKDLADDDNVKAVVLRVNSPGGSAYASEQIWHQVMNIKAKKPIVVSMGGYAASGGYYISCAANWIVAEPTTLTGSIGIFGMFPMAGELLNNKLGVHFNTVKTNKYADLGDISRPMNEGERQLIQGYINRGYELFTKRCADGRKMKQSDIKKIAEGRVWTGEHAKQIGLVDQLGNLDAAIEKAKKLGGEEEYTIASYPGKESIFDNLMSSLSTNSYAEAQLQETLGEYYTFFSSMRNISKQSHIQARVPEYFLFNL